MKIPVNIPCPHMPEMFYMFPKERYKRIMRIMFTPEFDKLDPVADVEYIFSRSFK